MSPKGINCTRLYISGSRKWALFVEPFENLNYHHCLFESQTVIKHLIQIKADILLCSWRTDLNPELDLFLREILCLLFFLAGVGGGKYYVLIISVSPTAWFCLVVSKYLLSGWMSEWTKVIFYRFVIVYFYKWTPSN